MDFFPPFSCVVISYSVFFLKTVAFQPIWRSRDVFWNSVFSNYLELTTKILFGFNLLSSFFSWGHFRVGFMCLPIHACCCSCQVMLVCPPLTSAPKLVLSSILSVCTAGDVYPKPHLLLGSPHQVSVVDPSDDWQCSLEKKSLWESQTACMRFYSNWIKTPRFLIWLWKIGQISLCLFRNIIMKVDFFVKYQ